MTVPFLTVKNLNVFFHRKQGDQQLLKEIDLVIPKGQVVGIVGESGSGKSMTMKSVMGILPENISDSFDSFVFEGQPVVDRSKLPLAMIFQDPMTSLNPLKVVGKQIQEAIELHRGLKGAEAKRLAIELLEDVGIANPEKRYNQYPHEFSGGMRQRVVIAIAIGCNPKILICDEPTTALDVTMQAQILDLLKNIQKQYKLTIVFITHDLGVVANVADRVAVMYAGDIVEVGLVEEIFYNAKHPYTWALLSSLPQLGVKGEELYSINGTPVNLYKEIKGDAFAYRNPRALKIDFEIAPPYFEVSKTHKAKTWLLDPRAPKVEYPKSLKRLFNLWEENKYEA